MINVKLLVLFLCFDNIREICTEYCEICPKHTLCMYKNPGPNPYCKLYDKTALITKDDVQNIVSKINQRRNFVALGLARHLPSAANMNKMEWSEELAAFAQRWVDQCDGAIRPDREDFCRDLADAKVGQNIATVTGYSPGLNVKSFVEIWFIEALDYTGSVTYYNESRESKTNYFTQLIWAETRLVGCGKARFSIDDRGTMVDRLVCNFAPRGNIQGKPVYTIGYPATQCKDGFQGDEMFSGLCKPSPPKKTTLAPAVNSLLRILNPPNRFMKQDTEPIRKDDIDEESMLEDIMSVGHQKIRHAPNQTHLIQHEIPLSLHNTDTATNTPTRHDAIPYHHTIDHLQNIHGAVYKTKQSTENNRRQYSNVKHSLSPHYDQASRRNIPYGICTRNSGSEFHDDTHNNDQHKTKVDQCTRGVKKNEYLLTTKPRYQNVIQRLPVQLPHDMCACNSQKTTCSPSTTQCTCNLNCHCLNTKKYESGVRRENPGEYFYYDIPELAVHGGEEVETKHLSKKSTNSIQKSLGAGFTKDDEDIKREYFTRKLITRNFNNQKVQGQLNFHRNFQNHKYPYGVVNPRQRSKRQTGDQFADKPFWKVNEKNNQPQLKSLRYTTLSNNRRKKMKTSNVYQIWTEKTEPITIPVEDETEHQHDVTEKFLSFDELMHLRKINGGETGFNIRRGGGTTKATAKTTAKATTKPTAATAAKATTKPTAKTTAKATTTQTAKTTPKATTTDTTVPQFTNTQFKPLKVCSRKVTCTWTAPTVTDSDGKVVDSGRGDHGGSRTPPGYVDGCTRTSTCTREFMNRNRLANSTDASGNVTPEDEDYCERRSLDLKRKDGSGTIRTLDQSETHTESSIHVTNSMKSENTEIDGDCSCDDQETRNKRNAVKKLRKRKPSSNQTNNDDYYYLILGKILKMINNRHKNNPMACSCARNTSNSPLLHNLSYLFIFLGIMFTPN